MNLRPILEAIDHGITGADLALATPLVSIHDSDGRVVCAASLPHCTDDDLVARVGAAAMLNANMGGSAVSVAARAHLNHDGWSETGIFYMMIDDEGEAEAATRTDRGFEFRQSVNGPLLDGLSMGLQHEQDQGYRWVDFLHGEGYVVRFPTPT